MPCLSFRLIPVLMRLNDHPDKGGDTPYAQTLQIAYAYIRRFG